MLLMLAVLAAVVIIATAADRYCRRRAARRFWRDRASPIVLAETNQALRAFGVKEIDHG